MGFPRRKTTRPTSLPSVIRWTMLLTTSFRTQYCAVLPTNASADTSQTIERDSPFPSRRRPSRPPVPNFFLETRSAFRRAVESEVDLFLDDAEEIARIRRLSTTGDEEPRPLRLTFLTKSLEDLRGATNNAEDDRRIDFLLRDVVPRVRHFYSQLLSVVPYPLPSVTLPPDACFGEAGDDVPDRVDDSDLVVFVRGRRCGGGGTIAAATPCNLSGHDLRPVVGLVYYCLESDVLNGDDVDAAVQVSVHELAHVFGMNSDLTPFYRNRATGRPYTEDRSRTWTNCADDARRRVVRPSTDVLQVGTTNTGARYFEIVTPTVRQVVRNQFNCPTARGARLENQPTADADCFGSHWDERLFHTESLGAFFGSEENSLSALTLALLEDTGWFYGNYTMVRTPTTFGHGAGCGFLDEDCIVDGGDVPDHARGFFCNRTSSLEEGRGALETTCSVTHRSVGYCDLFDFRRDEIDRDYLPPSKFRYFFDRNMSPLFFDRADFCPLPLPLEDGACGSDNVCVNMRYQGYGIATCTGYVCNERIRKLQILLGGETITCEEDFQMHEYPNFLQGYTFECPRLAVVCPDFICPANCSGKGVCDYDRDRPICECFDPNDVSPGCYGSDPESGGWETRRPTSDPTPHPSIRVTSPRTPSPTRDPTALPTKRPTTKPLTSTPTTKTTRPTPPVVTELEPDGPRYATLLPTAARETTTTVTLTWSSAGSSRRTRWSWWSVLAVIVSGVWWS